MNSRNNNSSARLKEIKSIPARSRYKKWSLSDDMDVLLTAKKDLLEAAREMGRTYYGAANRRSFLMR